jgi:hypothetical protein
VSEGLRPALLSRLRRWPAPWSRVRPGPARRGRATALAGFAAFAGALAITFAATAGGGAPKAGAPIGSLAEPLERSAPAAHDLSLARASAPPALDPVEALPALAAGESEPAPAVVAPTPVASAPAPERRAPAPQEPAVRAYSPPAPAPEPEPVAPAPPAPMPAPPPAPDPAPVSPVAPEPPPVTFDDSG